MESHHRLTVHPVLQPAERGTRRQFLVALQRRLPGRIAPQRGVIVEILVAQGQAVDALAQKRHLFVDDVERVARIGQHPIQRGDEPQTLVGLAQEQHAPVAAHLAPGETRLDLATIKAGKLE